MPPSDGTDRPGPDTVPCAVLETHRGTGSGTRVTVDPREAGRRLLGALDRHRTRTGGDGEHAGYTPTRVLKEGVGAWYGPCVSRGRGISGVGGWVGTWSPVGKLRGTDRDLAPGTTVDERTPPRSRLRPCTDGTRNRFRRAQSNRSHPGNFSAERALSQQTDILSGSLAQKPLYTPCRDTDPRPWYVNLYLGSHSVHGVSRDEFHCPLVRVRHECRHARWTTGHYRRGRWDRTDHRRRTGKPRVRGREEVTLKSSFSPEPPWTGPSVRYTSSTRKGSDRHAVDGRHGSEPALYHGHRTRRRARRHESNLGGAPRRSRPHPPMVRTCKTPVNLPLSLPPVPYLYRPTRPQTEPRREGVRHGRTRRSGKD